MALVLASVLVTSIKVASVSAAMTIMTTITRMTLMMKVPRCRLDLGRPIFCQSLAWEILHAWASAKAGGWECSWPMSRYLVRGRRSALQIPYADRRLTAD